jgi:Transposase
MSRDIKYIGMDVHKEATVIAVLNEKGNLVMESIVETKAGSLLQFIHGLCGELHVTWEEGTWAAWLYDLLKPHVQQVLVCDPRRNALLKEGSKNDKVDAQAGRLVAHGNAAPGLSRRTWTADAARAGT